MSDLKKKQEEAISALREWNRRKEEIIASNNLSDKEQVVRFFSYFNISFAEPSFCPLYAESKYCHKMSPRHFNCLGCYCDHYDVDYLKNGKFGRCKIDSLDGKYTDGIWDCSECHIPHFTENYGID